MNLFLTGHKFKIFVIEQTDDGKKFNRGGLFYWDKNIQIFKLIPIGYMKKEAEMLIEHYKMKRVVL